MNTKRVTSVADAICRAQKNGTVTPTGIAMALEGMCLLQSPETADEMAALRKERDAFRDQRNTVFTTNEELLTRVEQAQLERLQVLNENRALVRENGRLRARVAGLEAATYVAPSPSCTRCYGADAARFVAKGGATTPCRACGPSQVEQLQARVAELEAAAGDGHTRTVDEDRIAYALTEKAEALHASSGAVVETPGDVTPQVRKLRALLAGQREDAHDSELHRPYALGRDLPEPGVRS